MFVLDLSKSEYYIYGCTCIYTEKRLSKIDTLRLAISYIALLRDLLITPRESLDHIEYCLRTAPTTGNTAVWNTSGEEAACMHQPCSVFGSFILI